MNTLLIIIAIAAFGFAMFLAGTAISIWSADEMYNHIQKDALDEIMHWRMKLQKMESDITIISQRLSIVSIDVTCINSDVKVLKDWAHAQQLKEAREGSDRLNDKCSYNKTTHSVKESIDATVEAVQPVGRPKRKYVWKRTPGRKPLNPEPSIEQTQAIAEEK